MASNRIQNLSPEALLALGRLVQSKIGSTPGGPYGVSITQIGAVEDETTSLGVANDAVESSRAAWHEAVQERLIVQQRCSDAVVSVANTAYGNPLVTPSMIAALGLSPRSKARAKVVPQTPIELTATPTNNGTIVVRWNRNGNPQGVNFLVEGRSGGGEWGLLQDTTAASLKLSGFAGQAMEFRVAASKGGVTSAPSEVASVFTAVEPSEDSPSLRLAA